MRVFKESQKFTQSWVIILLTISFIVTIISLSKEWSKKLDKSLSSNLDLLLALAVFILVISFMLILKLKTRIDNEGIKYQFYPIHLKFRTITWNKIEKVYVRKYNPITEYGGWGLKGCIISRSRGTAYNVSGNIGIQLELKSGKKILIGTKQKLKAEQVLQYYKNKEND